MANQSTAQTETNDLTATPASLSPVMSAVDRSDPRKELNRVKELTFLATAPLSQRVDALERLEGWINEGVTFEAARAFVLAELATQSPKIHRSPDEASYGQNSVGHSWDNGDGLNSKIVDGICASPGAPDGLQHAYLDGVAGPQLFTREGFEIDGVEYKVRMDFGAGFTDHRGWYMSPSS